MLLFTPQCRNANAALIWNSYFILTGFIHTYSNSSLLICCKIINPIYQIVITGKNPTVCEFERCIFYISLKVLPWVHFGNKSFSDLKTESMLTQSKLSMVVTTGHIQKHNNNNTLQ